MKDRSKVSKCIFEWSKMPKRRILAVFRTLVCWIDLISHILIELYVFHHSATLPGHNGSFRNPQNAFLNDPKCQKGRFWPFSWLRSVGLTWYCILWWELTISNIWQCRQVMKVCLKVTKLHFWMIQNAKK